MNNHIYLENSMHEILGFNINFGYNDEYNINNYELLEMSGL